MSVFYIDSESEGVFELTSTTNIKVNQTSRATKHPIEEGNTATDHVVNNNTTITFDGILSDILRLNPEDEGANSQRNVEGFITPLRRLRDSKELFTVYYDNRDFGVADNCYITNLDVERDSVTGEGFKVNLSFEQVRVVRQANVTTSVDDQAEPDTTQDETNSSGSNTEDVDEDWTNGLLNLSLGSTIIGAVTPAPEQPSGGG